MKLTRTFKFNPALVNLVPMANVLFLVVTFFALSSRFVLQPGLAVSLPVSTFALSPPQNAQLVSIVSAPVPSIYHRDQSVTLDELAERLKRSPAKDRSMILRADRSTPYDFIVQVMNRALAEGYSVVLATSPAQ